MSQAAQPLPSSPILRFGDFVIDRRARELRRNGARVPLQEQPFQVLALLAEHAGELVTRDEVRQHLWPSDTFVDFDNSLNAAISKIREALGDSVSTPRFIETLPRRGYRFIPTLEEAPNSLPPIQLSPGTSEAPVTRHSPQLVLAIAVIVPLILATVAFFLFQTRAEPKIVGSTQLTDTPETKFPLLAGDSSRVYFSQGNGGQAAPAQVSVAGGVVAPISTPLKNVHLRDVSPDGSELLATSNAEQLELEGSLWILPALGGTPRSVDGIRAHAASWSPDGEWIVYASGMDLYVVSRDGSNRRKLVTAPGVPDFPRWSPNGTTLRFDLRQEKDSSIWEVAADGSHLHPLLDGWNHPPRECCGNWTSDGKYYVFQSTRDGLASLWAIRERVGLLPPASRQPLRLTYGPMNLLAPLPSRDGKRLFVIGEQPQGELVRYDRKSMQWLPYLGGISAEGVSISGDGQWAAYVRYPEATLWRGKVDGSERLQLTGPPLIAGAPHWSPDGKQIVFSAMGGTQHVKSYLVAAEGGPPRPLTIGDEDEFAAAWSPDGRALAVGGLPFESEKGIRIVDARTRQISTLPGSTGLCCACWSPDGRSIIAAGVSPQRLMMFGFADRKWSELMEGPFNGGSFSRDGKYFYFDTERVADPAVYRLRISDRKVERVASLQGIRRTPGFLGDWFDLGPDDAPMVLRNLSNEQIYALEWKAP
jgi:Tol biopolymer transport system component/DNA-binding winged helix-turn-helix (wHTH) protein